METRELSDNHSIAYCLLSFLCAYYRTYYPLEFTTAFLNNASNDKDIAEGLAYAAKSGIKLVAPEWGRARSNFFYDKENNEIIRGISSIKFIGNDAAEELYDLSQKKTYKYFSKLIIDVAENTSVNKKQLDVLIAYDYFIKFGRQDKLGRLKQVVFEILKAGKASRIAKTKTDGTIIDEIVRSHSTDTTKQGLPAKNYTVIDMDAILRESEELILGGETRPLRVFEKFRSIQALTGDTSYCSGAETDRRFLYIMDIVPVRRKKDKKEFGKRVHTRSLGSGKESYFTVMLRDYRQHPIFKDDIIFCGEYRSERGFYTLTRYSVASPAPSVA